VIRASVQTALLAVAFALGCIALGWWSAALIGVLWGWRVRHRRRHSALIAGIGAAIGWSILLGWTALVGEAGALLATMASVFGVPGFLIPGVTVTIGSVLAVLGSWVGATLPSGMTHPGTAVTP
jgi:hypothetical protein